MKKILILGSSGLIGHQIYTQLESLDKYKVLGVPPQNGRRRTAGGSGHEAPLSVYPVGSSAVSGKGYTSKGNSLAMHPSEAVLLSAHPYAKTR